MVREYGAVTAVPRQTMRLTFQQPLPDLDHRMDLVSVATCVQDVCLINGRSARAVPIRCLGDEAPIRAHHTRLEVRQWH